MGSERVDGTDPPRQSVGATPRMGTTRHLAKDESSGTLRPATHNAAKAWT